MSVLPADYHSHTAFSDGEGDVWALVARAAELGLPEIGVSDHLVPVSLDDGFGVPHERLSEYVEQVRLAARRAAESGGPRVLLGLEVDYAPGTLDEVRALVRRYRPDYVICSVHFVDGFGFDDPGRVAQYAQYDLEALWCRYFRLVEQAAGCGLSTIAGHFDLIKKFGRRPRLSRSVVHAARSALRALARNGAAMEINTAGWRVPAQEQYPSAALIAHARSLGVPITFGSDAHRPEQVGSRFVDAVAVARGAGYTHWKRLSDGAAVPLP